jgi:hypothetical protein
MNLFEDTRGPADRQDDDLPAIYLDLGWAFQAARAKKDEGSPKGRLPLISCLADIAERRRQLGHRCEWSVLCGRNPKPGGVHQVVIDIEDRPVQGQNGFAELAALAALLGRSDGLIGEFLNCTPLCTSQSGYGLHIHVAWPGRWVPTGRLLPWRYIEIRGDGHSARVPPGFGRRWDEHGSPLLSLAPFPAWGWIGGEPVEAAETTADRAARRWEDLAPEPALDGRDFTLEGQRIAARIVAGLLHSTCTREACGRVRSLGNLFLTGKISESYGAHLVEQVGRLLGPFAESGCHAGRLLPALHKAFSGACHGR